MWISLVLFQTTFLSMLSTFLTVALTCMGLYAVFLLFGAAPAVVVTLLYIGVVVLHSVVGEVTLHINHSGKDKEE